MEFTNNKPIGEFLKSLKKKRFSEIYISSPFISESGSKLFADFVDKRKGLTIKLLTNLNPMNVVFSLSNPVSQLAEFERNSAPIKIRNNPHLHAKLFLVPGKSALFGSSNLTRGGELLNDELNMLLTDKTKKEQELIADLYKWFNDQWENHSFELSRDELKDLNNIWENNFKKIQKSMYEFIPEPRLGGDYWQKLKKLMKKSPWKREDFEKELAERSGKGKNNAPNNTSQKLFFLQYLGLIDCDQQKVKILKKIQSKEEMFKLLEERAALPLGEIIGFLSDRKEANYTELTDNINAVSENNRTACIEWLISLGYIKRNAKNRRNKQQDVFSLK